MKYARLTLNIKVHYMHQDIMLQYLILIYFKYINIKVYDIEEIKLTSKTIP